MLEVWLIVQAAGTFGINLHNVSDRKFMKDLEYLILKGKKRAGRPQICAN